MTYQIDEFDIAATSDDRLAPIVDAANRLNREAQPRSVDLSLDEFRMFADSPGMVRHRFTVRDGDERLIGMGETRYPDDGTNPDLLLCMNRILPEYRRHGAGTAILNHQVGRAEEAGRNNLKGFYLDTVPAGQAFANAVGATANLDFHENVLRLDQLDRELMKTWSEIGEERAPGYSIELHDGEIPATWHDDIAHLFYVLERDMPMPPDFEPTNWTAERVREMLEHYAKGTDSLSALAIHDATGTAVGMSQLIRRHSDPTTWMVTVTMVEPEHRGKSLGKWVKGTANVAALERWESGVYQETGNAFTNEAMLAINTAMGFEHESTVTDCSISVADARAYLASRGN